MAGRNYRLKVSVDGREFEAEGDKRFVLDMVKRFGPGSSEPPAQPLKVVAKADVRRAFTVHRGEPGPRHTAWRFKQRGGVSHGATLVPVVETADLGDGDDFTHLRRLKRSGMWRICVQRQMCPYPMIGGKISRQHAAQMCRTEDDDVIQTLAAD